MRNISFPRAMLQRALNDTQRNLRRPLFFDDAATYYA
jgi:hypothetical protein